jgi:hypothetical protein
MTTTPTQQPRAYSAAHFALELDDKKSVGLFRSIEGGGVKVAVASSHNSHQFEKFQQLGKPTYEDIKVQVGMAMSQPFYDWIEAFFRGEVLRKTGAIVAADFYYKERARREFDQAMITELAFPKLDGEDKSPCYMTVTFCAETIKYVKGSGDPLAPSPGFDRQKLWAACNFEFSIDGFETACQRVTKVDGFSIKQKAIDYHHGEQRHATKLPGRIEYPNLTFYVPESDAQPFFDAYQKIGLGGELQSDQRMHGKINTKDNSDGQLFTIEFFGAEFVNVAVDKSDAGSDAIKMVKIEMCTETMTFMYLPMMVE